MNQTEFNDILSQGTEGEGIAALKSPPFMLDYNAVLILAVRYLQPGPDTDAVKDANINWDKWPMQQVVGGTLPEHWPVLGKGILLNYFKWKGSDIKKGRP